MSFEEVVVVEPEFLRIAATGKYVFAELFDFLDRVKIEADKARRNRVLIDERELEGKMTEAEKFQGGKRVAAVFGPRIKVAVLTQPDRITKLGELTAVNRGAKFLVTAAEDEALKWLLQS